MSYSVADRDRAQELSHALGVRYQAALRLVDVEAAATPLERTRAERNASRYSRVHSAILDGTPALSHEQREFLRAFHVDIVEETCEIALKLEPMRCVTANAVALGLSERAKQTLTALWPAYERALSASAEQAQLMRALISRALLDGCYELLSAARLGAALLAALRELVRASEAIAAATWTIWHRDPAERRGIEAYAFAFSSLEGPLATVWHCSGYAELTAKELIGTPTSGQERPNMLRSCFPGDGDQDADAVDWMLVRGRSSAAEPWRIAADYDVEAALAARQAAAHAARLRRRPRWKRGDDDRRA